MSNCVVVAVTKLTLNLCGKEVGFSGNPNEYGWPHYVPYRGRKFYRSSAQFRSWDPKSCEDCEKIATKYPRKEKTEKEELMSVELENEFSAKPPKKRLKSARRRIRNFDDSLRLLFIIER